MAVPCTIIMAATVLTALTPPIYCLEETREPSRDPRRHRENMLTPRRDLPIVNSSSFPLNMVPDAIDDKYEGCDKEMEKKVEVEYFKKENVGRFKRFWGHREIAECSKKDSHVLNENHTKAICLQTSRYIYKEFNEAVRTGKNIYGSDTFIFHYFHYWLTTALQILNRNQKKPGCQTTYRRTKSVFTGKVGDIIRFGTFSSSSTRPDLFQYGSKTCFKITTCLGAYLGDYEMNKDQKEVLIPPYEKFKITSDKVKRKGALRDCEKVFVLTSAGEESNLNCKLANK